MEFGPLYDGERDRSAGEFRRAEDPVILQAPGVEHLQGLPLDRSQLPTATEDGHRPVINSQRRSDEGEQQKADVGLKRKTGPEMISSEGHEGIPAGTEAMRTGNWVNRHGPIRVDDSHAARGGYSGTGWYESEAYRWSMGQTNNLFEVPRGYFHDKQMYNKVNEGPLFPNQADPWADEMRAVPRGTVHVQTDNIMANMATH